MFLNGCMSMSVFVIVGVMCGILVRSCSEVVFAFMTPCDLPICA